MQHTHARYACICASAVAHISAEAIVAECDFIHILRCALFVMFHVFCRFLCSRLSLFAAHCCLLGSVHMAFLSTDRAMDAIDLFDTHTNIISAVRRMENSAMHATSTSWQYTRERSNSIPNMFRLLPMLLDLQGRCYCRTDRISISSECRCIAFCRLFRINHATKSEFVCKLIRERWPNIEATAVANDAQVE